MYSIEFTVTQADIDFNNHVNNIVYLKWAQQISKLHWENNATMEQKNTYLWVIARQEIDYLHELKLGDILILKTWIQNTIKHKSERVVEMYIKDSAVLAAKAVITWTLLLKETKKPTRITLQIEDLFKQ